MIHGVLNIYKEKGYTSHDVVAKLRGITGQKKIGHTGTLDPEAEGVLPVCLGRATKLCGLLTDKDKTYETVLLLGIKTDTQDMTGNVLERNDTAHLTKQAVTDCIHTYIGEYQQLPPMYSALKVGGKKLCDLAREGKTVERKRRSVQIHDISILEMNLPRVKLRIDCSKGTYIRTLCHDIGDSLGTGGCMESLLRTQVERFVISKSHVLSEVEAYVKGDRLPEILTPIDQMFSEYQKAILKESAVQLAYNGNPLEKKHFQGTWDPGLKKMFRVYDACGNFVGLYEYQQKTEKIKLIKMFYQAEEQN